MNLYHRSRAFTLVEVSVATCIFALLGLVTYGVASEGLFAFSRNVSINRSYGEARRALDRIGSIMQTAGYAPLLVDATGASTTTSPAAGICVWRYSSTPCYDLPVAPVATLNTFTISLYQPGSTTILQPAPAIGDLITISAIGFQAKVSNVSPTPTGSTTATLTFGGTVGSYCTAKTIPVTSSITLNNVTTTSTIQYNCLDYTPSAVIAVGTQLRYYPTFIYGPTAVATTTNYKVLTNLVSTVGGVIAPLPFTLGTFPTVNVDLYAEAPDYNNNTRNIGSANTYTYIQTAFASRNPSLLSNPY